MSRTLYTLLLVLYVPWILIKLIRRGFRDHSYWQRWGERFGFYSVKPLSGSIWLHAVSVGEVQAVLPLIDQLRNDYPQMPLVVTTMTPTGSARVRAVYDQSLVHVYAPYDLPGPVRRFLDRFQPRLLLLMETEIWPNTISECKRRGIKVILANARLSERSMSGYRRIASLARRTLQKIDTVAVQSKADAERFIALGADAATMHVTGSIKLDIRVPASVREQADALRRSLGVNRAVWLAASTHPGEEEMVLKAFTQIRTHSPDCLLVLVPRHPERGADVAALCKAQAYSVKQRSLNEPVEQDTAVYIADTLGELPHFCAASDVVFMGGSFVPVGGHNMVEPAALGVPVITGPILFNFTEISEQLVQAGAMQVVQETQELAAAVIDLLRNANRRHAIGERGRGYVEQNRGALHKLLTHVKALLD